VVARQVHPQGERGKPPGGLERDGRGRFASRLSGVACCVMLSGTRIQIAAMSITRRGTRP